MSQALIMPFFFYELIHEKGWPLLDPGTQHAAPDAALAERLWQPNRRSSLITHFF